MPELITEARTVAEATPIQGSDGRFLLRLIDAGRGSSGIYPAQTLEAAAQSRVFPAGLQCFMDHPGYAESYDRPERSVKDLAAVLTEDARWDPTTKALVAEARVFGAFREVLTDMADSIGVSIRATAEVEQGEAEGYKGLVVTELLEGISADFVTRAGRGGKIMAVLESARVNEATSDDRRDQVQRALPARSYLRDYDPDRALAWYVTYDNASDRAAVWQQTYETATDDQSVTLTGIPVEVRPVMNYLPVTQQQAVEAAPQTTPAHNDVPDHPAGHTTTESSQEMNMAQIDDRELTQLRESAGRVSTLESERDQAKTRADQAEKALADERRMTTATKRAQEAVKDLHPVMAARIVESVIRDLPVTDQGALDTAKLDEAITKATEAEQAYAKEFAPAGVTGFGATSTAAESTAPTRTHNAWGRPIVKEA